MTPVARGFAAAFLAAVVWAQVPPEDLRNTYTPDPNTRFTMPHYGTRRAWGERRNHLRRQILSAAGLLPLPDDRPLRSHLVWRSQSNGVRIETLLLETLPGYFVGGNVYLPVKLSGRAPAVLSPHGHWKRGRLEHQASYSVPALCVNLARQGYVAFTWDMVGYNDTRQTPHDFGGWREQLWSFNPMGLQLWNSICALDYIESRRDVDPRRIAVTGASGGGTQTFLLAAVDDRVRASAPVNMISAHMQGGDPCEEAPNLRRGAFNVEFAAMMAPRPMLMVSCTGDWTRETPDVEFPWVRAIYELYGAAGQVANRHFDGGHNYDRRSREAVYAFLAQQLLRNPAAVDLTDHAIEPLNDDDLLALRHTRLPSHALSYEALFENWRKTARAQNAKLRTRELRESLRYALGAEWPGEIDMLVSERRLVLSRRGRGDRVSGIWIPGRTPPALVVDSDGADAARLKPAVAEMIGRGRFVYLIDAFQTGSAVARRNRSSSYFLSYNQTDDAHRVQDILTALAFLKRQAGGTPELVGLNQAAIWCLFAAAVAPVSVDLSIDLNGFSGSDEEFRDRFFVPGIQRAGGLSAALKLAGGRAGAD